MPLKRVEQQENDVLDLTELKAHLNLDGVTRFDIYLGKLIKAIEAPTQEALGIQLLQAGLQWTMKEFKQITELPRPPLMEVTKVEYRDVNGDWQLIDAGSYEVNTDATPGFVRFDNDFQPAATYENEVYPWRYSYNAGYGANTGSVPAEIELRMMNAIGTHFMKREDFVISGQGSVSVQELEKVMARLVKSHNARNRFG